MYTKKKSNQIKFEVLEIFFFEGKVCQIKFPLLKSRSTKKPYKFDRNPKRKAISKKEQQKTAEKNAFGPRTFPLNWTISKLS